MVRYAYVVLAVRKLARKCLLKSLCVEDVYVSI